MPLFNALRKATFQYPFAVWGIALGVTGPLLVLTVPPILNSFGYRDRPAYPDAYPLPNRARRPTVGYEDETSN